MNVLLINQYAPPDASPTALLAGDIAAALEARGHTVRFAGATAGYAGRRHRGVARWIHEVRSLGGLARAALGGARPEVIIAFTSPPCVLLVAALAAARHRARLLHWVMDLYPDIAVALGEIPPFAGSLLAPLMGAACRRCERIVALDRDMAARLSRHRLTPDILPPWHPGGLPALPEDAANPRPPGRSGRVWLYSGNLGRAHEWRTLLKAQALLENSVPDSIRWRLVFQGGGPQTRLARDEAARLGLRDCEFRDYAPPGRLVRALLDADVLLATQNPATLGCLWPSKLALAMALPRPILWVGPPDGAVAETLRASPANGVFAPGHATEIAAWLQQAAAAPRPSPTLPPNPRDPMSTGTAAWLRWVEK